jgi:hypothetical protein
VDFRPVSCKDILLEDIDNYKDMFGVKTIYVGGNKKDVLCDMSTDPGGLTVSYMTSCNPNKPKASVSI